MTAPTPKISAKELSEQIGVDAKTFRVYLRANAVPKDDESERYEFTKAQATKHVKQYPEWAAHRAEARKAAQAAKDDATDK